MLNRLPIKISAPLLVGIPVLVVGVCLSVMWNRQSRQAVDELAERNIGQIHEMAADKVAEMLAVPMRVCQVNGHLVESGALDPADLTAWRPTLVEEARAFDMLSSIVWGDADGRAAWVTRYADGANYWALKDEPASPTMQEWPLDAAGDIAGEPNTFDFELYGRPWYATAVEAGEPAWCEPYVWVGGGEGEEKTLGISYGVPLYATGEDSAPGELLGVVDADFSLNDLSSYLESMHIGKTGVAALLTPDGRLLAVSNETQVVTTENQRALAADSADAMIATAGRYVAAHEEDGFAEELSERLEVAGSPHYLRISPVGTDAGLPWLLVTVVPESDFTGEIDAGFRRSWLASLLAVALAIAVGFAAARWLVSPLVRLVTAVRRIGQGDLETRVDLEHAPEYANLVAEINQMTTGLQDRHRMRQSLSLAMEVQKNLLPDEAPEVGGLDIAGHSTYCDETGGDYYDFLDVHGVDDDTAVIAIGDVMGHGVAAAMLMATARGILRSRCSVPGSLADFLEHLNAMLTRRYGRQPFHDHVAAHAFAASRRNALGLGRPRTAAHSQHEDRQAARARWRRPAPGPGRGGNVRGIRAGRRRPRAHHCRRDRRPVGNHGPRWRSLRHGKARSLAAATRRQTGRSHQRNHPRHPRPIPRPRRPRRRFNVRDCEGGLGRWSSSFRLSSTLQHCSEAEAS